MSSTLIYFDGEYYKYHGVEREEQGLAIGGYESEFLADLLASQLFEKSKANFHLTTYHIIYRDDGLVAFKGNKSTIWIKYWQEKFQKTANKAAGNQHLQFTAEIWTTEDNPTTPAKEERVQIVTNDEFPFLDMKTSWSSEGDLQFGVFKKTEQ